MKLKIIFLICAIHALVAALTLTFTHRQVKQAMFEAEQNSVVNVLRLVELNIMTGYRTLLRSRIDAVMDNRRLLRARTVSARNRLNEIFLASGPSEESRRQAIREALDWVGAHPLEDDGSLFIFDSQGAVLAHAGTAFESVPLDQVRDMRGLTLVDSVRFSIKRTGEAYAAFSRKRSDLAEPVRKVGYFLPFPPMDWHIGTSMSIGALEREGDRKLQELLDVLRDKFAEVRLGEAGFLVLFDSEGQTLIKPEGMTFNLLGAVNALSGQPVLHDLRALAASPTMKPLRVSLRDSDGRLWKMDAYCSHFRSLDWYVAAMVFPEDLVAPAGAVARQLSWIISGTLVFSLALGLVLAARVTRPLNLLAEHARRLPESDFSSPEICCPAIERLQRERRDEAGRLASAMIFMEQSLREKVRDLIENTAAQERLAGELAERKRSEQQLTLQNRLQELLVDISSEFINLAREGADKAVQASLGKLGMFVNADRAYVFACDPDRQLCINTHEWCARGIKPQISALQAVQVSEIQGIMDTLGRGQMVHLPDVAALPPDSAQRSHLEAQGIKSMFCAPMLDEKDCIGVVGFDFVRERRSCTQTEQRLLLIFAHMLANLHKRMDMEMELRQSRGKAEAASLAKSRFLANMSHEIRTPMNSVMGFAQILDRDPSLNPDQAEHVRRILRSADSLLGLINDILDMSRIEAGMVELEAKDFHLLELVHEMESLFRVEAGSRGLRFVMETDPGLPPVVCGDLGKLRQILINLLGNAVKFTLAGHITVRVRVESGPAGASADQVGLLLVVEVEDTGPGIAGQDLEDVFAPFVQEGSGVRAGGTGLGLSISRSHARLMGGDLTVASRVGQGSCFRLETPLMPARGEYLRQEALRQAVGLEPGSGPWRILAVDDKPDNLALLASLLRPIGFEVRQALNGAQALRIFEDWAPHAVLMDMRMPVMDGFEATRRIKATQAGQATLVVAVTAGAFEDSRKAVMDSGADACLTKPFRAEQLFEALARGLGLRYVFADEPLSHSGPIAAPLQTPRFSRTTVQAIRQAVARGDIVQLMDLAGQARREDAQAARILRDMVDNFDYARITSWLDAV